MTTDLEAIKRVNAMLDTLSNFLLGDWWDCVDRNDLIAALTALRPVAEGKAVIVPVEPTEAMLMAGIVHRHDQTVPEAWLLATVNIYRAMLKAAP